jgi:hypothetical protein
MFCVLMKCVVRLLLDVFSFVIADTARIIMFDVNYFYFYDNALVVGIKITV